MKNIYFIIFILLCISCKEKIEIKNPYQVGESEGFKLEKVSSKNLNLSKYYGHHYRFYQLIETDTSQLYSFIDYGINGIAIYNFDNGEFVKEIPFEVEGPNGIGQISAFNIVQEDDIYVYSEGSMSLFFVNSESEVLKRWKFSIQEERPVGEIIFEPRIDVWGFSPMYLKGEELLMPGIVTGDLPKEMNDSNTFIFSKLNLESSEQSLMLTYPSEYNNGAWYNQAFRGIHTALHGDSLLISFPISHDIRIVDLKTMGQKEISAPSPKIKTIKELGIPIDRSTSDQRIDHYLESGTYGPILWDKFRKLYYRVNFVPVPEHLKLQNPKIYYKDLNVTVFDKDFNFLGDEILDGSVYSNIHMVVLKEGLALYHYKNYNEVNDRVFQFDIFVPTYGSD